jgi:chromosome segregation ATPase
MSDSANKSPSHYLDDLKSSLSNLRIYIFGRTIEAPAETGGAGDDDSSSSDLDLLAQVNEDIRERCIGIVNRADELVALRNEFIEVFGEVGKILRDTEGTTSALVERSAMLALEEEEHSALKARHRALYDDYEKKNNELALLRSEVESNGELVSTRELRIQALEQHLSEEKDQFAALRNELDQERYMGGLTSEKLQAALGDVRADEALLAALQAQVAALSDRSSAAEFHVSALEASLSEGQALAKGLRDSLADSQQNAESLSRRLDEANGELEALRTRTETVEATLSAERLEREVAQAVAQQKDQATADEIASLRAQLDADRARAEAGEAQLAEARAELQTTGSELRAKEREVEILAARIAPLDERLDSAIEEIVSLTDKLAEAERSRVLLADRAQALVRAMTDQLAKLELAEQRAQLLEGRLASEATRFAADNEQLERKIHELNERFEREKAARVVAAGALEAARSRVVRQREATSLHDVLTRADESVTDEPLIGRLGGRALPAVSPGGTRQVVEGAGRSVVLQKASSIAIKRESTRRGGRT